MEEKLRRLMKTRKKVRKREEKWLGFGIGKTKCERQEGGTERGLGGILVRETP